MISRMLAPEPGNRPHPTPARQQAADTLEPPDAHTAAFTGDDGVGSAAGGTTETRAERFRRKAHRGRLYGYAIGAVALVAMLVALGASNTAQVKVSWVFGSSHVSLVWIVLFAAIVGWALGLITGAWLHWRTRSPRPTRTAGP